MILEQRSLINVELQMNHVIGALVPPPKKQPILSQDLLESKLIGVKLSLGTGAKGLLSLCLLYSAVACLLVHADLKLKCRFLFVPPLISTIMTNIATRSKAHMIHPEMEGLS